MELCDASLEGLVNNRYTHPLLNLENPVEIFRQIVQALKYLSKHKMAYRNINPWNILVSKDVIKLADFSISRVAKSGKDDITNSNSSSAKKRKANWTAPEIILKDQRYDVQVDIFSTGCVFGYVLLKGIHPFGDTENQIERNMLEDKAINVSKIQNENGRDLVARMLEPKSEKRITIDQIEKHPYFWDETMALRFIREVCGLFENTSDDKRKAKAKLETEEIRKRIFGDDWSVRLEQEVVVYLFGSKNYQLKKCKKKETFALLKTIRNKVGPSILRPVFHYLTNFHCSGTTSE